MTQLLALLMAESTIRKYMRTNCIKIAGSLYDVQCQSFCHDDVLFVVKVCPDTPKLHLCHFDNILVTGLRNLLAENNRTSFFKNSVLIYKTFLLIFLLIIMNIVSKILNKRNVFHFLLHMNLAKAETLSDVFVND